MASPTRAIDSWDRISRRRAGKLAPARPPGGWIAIGGPPFGGKSVLAAELIEWLPRAIKVERVDDLGTSGEGTGSASALLAQAKEICEQSHPMRRPTIVIVARFGSPARRLRARSLAHRLAVPFLFVESRSTDARARERMFARVGSEREARTISARYRAAMRLYRPIGRGEQIALPAVCLRRVQSHLEAAVARTLSAWSRT
jgi:hypothetical protein